MNRCYADIIDKLGEPSWFDENAVPRYCEFHPSKLDIYAREAALVLIKCQSCDKEFNVAFSMSTHQLVIGELSIQNSIVNEMLEYGDPPSLNCCAAGPTMTAITHKVLEYWERPDHNWVRDSELEKTFEVENESL